MEFQLKRTDSRFNRKGKDDHECEGCPDTICVIWWVEENGPMKQMGKMIV